MPKINIFGSSGFVGTTLRRLFDKNGMQYSSPSTQEIDLAQTTLATYNDIEELVNDGDAIVMLAGLTNEYGAPSRLTAENVTMAANLLWGISGKKISHFIYMSSDSVYGKGKEAPFYDIIDEEYPLAPNNLYGFMHALREQYFRDYFMPEKLTILRPCAIYGEGDTHNAYGINQFIRSANKDGIIEIFGNGEEMRPSIHVDDMATIISMTLEKKIAGTFNVNCGISLTFKDVAEIIKNNIGKEIKIRSKPRTEPITHRIFDNSELITNFFSPRAAEEGIRQVLHGKA